ncbi:leucine-rich repeat-containing protein 37A-like [Myotis myotis]|uniref:leucine-rich repeat-containing protein 37A-like n=1 Tax=Myotis myotis TaxID=51298 RepID=UPI00174CCAD7|nr:leucine-rich repeat-containing protein 37A-like [Myotis myotis]
MSGLHMWAPRFLFLWQLLWLQVQAAPIPELAVDSSLLTSIALGPTEPWSWNQQNPANLELPSVNHVLAEAPEKTEPSPNPQEASTQLPTQQEASTQSAVSHEPLILFDHHGDQDKQQPYPEYVQSSKSSTLPPVSLASTQTSSVHLKGQGQLPESTTDVEAQPSVNHEAISSLPDWGKIQHQVLSISLDDVDLGILIKPKTPKKNEPPATDKEVSSYPPRPTENINPPYQQEIPAQPISQADILQQTTAPPKHSEVTVPRPQPVQTQQSTFPHLDLGLTITPEPTLVTDAPPKHPEMTLPYSEPIQALQPTLSEVSALSFDMEVAKTQQLDSYEMVPLVTEQSATMNICEFCTCSIGTLSCIGFGTNQKLNKVPVSEPGIYNGTFTILNLQGNAISYIGKDTWKSYHLVEKLNLSGNNLRELRKDSFEGLFSLQYLDLSCNKIEFIERNAFESLPFLQYINLGCNSITKVNFGTFQASHGMQFLHKLILNRNPLTTVQDPYLFNLPALKYLDMGATQVSFTTLDNILKMTLPLEKLILPSHLACCLCHFKNNIEAVAKSVKLHCDNECLVKTRCDEQVLTEGPFMKILEGRKKYNSSELTIEPERTAPKKNSETLSAFMSLLMKLLDEQQEVKVSKGELDTEQWKNEGMEALGEQEEEESNEFRNEVPGFKNYNKVIIASPVIAVVAFYFVVFCLIAICHRKEASKESSRGSLESVQKNKSAEYQLEEGGFFGRPFLWLKNLFSCLLSIFKKNEQKSQDTAEDEAFLKMEQSEEATGERINTSEYPAEEPAEESEE